MVPASGSVPRIQRIPAGDREVPSSQIRKIIAAPPLDPTSDLAGALRGLPDRRGLRVVPRPEIPQRLQEPALILRRAFPQCAPLRVSDHFPSRSPTSTLAKLCGDTGRWSGIFVAA